MKDLKFVHITKTAGTSIELAGLASGIAWGMNHKEYGWWHEIPTRKSKELIDQHEWFAVVRNPYERIVSEFHCVWGRARREEETRTAIETGDKELFNRVVREKIRARSIRGDHYTEQHKYLVEGIKILRFENLQEEFSKLMSEKGLEVSLGKSNVSEKKFSYQDFDKNTISVINEVYKEDFLLFGYSRLWRLLSRRSDAPPTSPP